MVLGLFKKSPTRPEDLKQTLRPPSLVGFINPSITLHQVNPPQKPTSVLMPEGFDKS